MLKNKFKLTHFVLIVSFLNFILFHFPFFKFVFNNLDYKTLNGIFVIISLVILMLVLNAFVFYLFFNLSRRLSKFLLILFFIINAISVYFINTYGVIIDESMIGNVFNTNSEESGSYFSLKMILYIVFLGILPSIFIYKAQIIKVPLKKYFITISITLAFILSLIFANASNWLWIDKNSKTLGGLAMPWSYTVNTARHFIHQHDKNKKEIKLPDATIENNEKSVVVLVIGESARSQNFSLYGYEKNTNPLLSKTPNVYHFKANSSATYTTAGVKSILDYKKTKKLYEILPNYLFRNNVDVVWKSTNWGEPPLHIKDQTKKKQLVAACKGSNCSYDEILIDGLKERILKSDKNKILIVLHTSTSHGPSYNKKYPAQFEVFKPVCGSVELSNCTQTELINAYDNTIVYTDYLLHKIIEDLQGIKDYKSSMLFVSDHGESLGEKNLYMHGLPMSLAPQEQFDIPFIVWVSDNSMQLKPNEMLTQYHVFHSVLKFLDVKSPIYDEQMNIFVKK